MTKLICPRCRKVYEISKQSNCPQCTAAPNSLVDFTESEKFLKDEVALALEERKNHGLDGLVGGLECIIVNVEQDRQRAVVEEMLRYTGLRFEAAFRDSRFTACLLKNSRPPDFLVRTRLGGDNPFTEFNVAPKSKHLPNTRLETFVFKANDIDKYVSIQKKRGARFLTDDVIRTDAYSFIQTIPSVFTGNSLGFIQWKDKRGAYFTNGCEALKWEFKKPSLPHLKNIFEVDHAATRVKAQDRDASIIEFMDLTNYNFDFAIYVKVFNSITNVARLTHDDYAMVFTTGIEPFTDPVSSGPTEKFIYNYNKRVHHVAFRTENIDETYDALKADKMQFLIELVGSPDEGLKQTFTQPSANTLLINEYIHRFGDFDGFFTKSNVTLLTGATDRQ